LTELKKFPTLKTRIFGGHALEHARQCCYTGMLGLGLGLGLGLALRPENGGLGLGLGLDS